MCPADPYYLLLSLGWLVTSLHPDTCAWAIREPSSPWCLLAASSPLVGLWAEFLAGEGVEPLRVYHVVMLGRQGSPAVGSGIVPPPTPSQVSIIFDKDCTGYQVSTILSTVFGVVLSAVSLVN